MKMYKICRTEKSFARQRELENGLLAYMESVSFFDMEIADLCRYLQIPRKTFYRYFGSKEDALYALVDHRLWDLNRRMDPGLSDAPLTLEDTLLYFFRFWKEERYFLDVLIRGYLGIVLVDRAMQSGTLSQRMMESSAQNISSEQAYHLHFLTSGLMALVFRWHLTGYTETDQHLVQIAAALLRNPMHGLSD